MERESVLFCTKFTINSMLKTTERSSRGLIYIMAESKPMTISCHFCQALISFKMATKDKFEKHMEVVHEVHLDFDLLLALHMLGEEERASLVRAAKGRAMSSLGVDIGPQALSEDQDVQGRLAFVPAGAIIAMEKSKPSLPQEVILVDQLLLSRSKYFTFSR